ncbi:hypothetical protein HOU03_gp403 [Caulobacter phage CcrSC]|uniref:Uncharacterized protein n=1 Tax=Caulobacter phage CcrSC TaxID=2283272 RepID=A0A385EFQ1_9CAUD|nr:hypothetical protein HOU03_gp403 [Caulobacter phage CcrSC]AXQ69865.1 hypothetical protein CcrSC_gp283 [Caulobacter phage CcrSC]
MVYYATRYGLPNGSIQITQCYAESEEHLKEVMAARGMGEVHHPTGYAIAKPTMPSAWLEKRDYAKAIHALTWAAMIAVKSGVDAWTLLHDRGLMHELAHLNEYNTEVTAHRPMDAWLNAFGHPSGLGAEPIDLRARRLKLVDDLKAFEATVPGLAPTPPKITTADYSELEKRVMAYAYDYLLEDSAIEFKTAPKKGEKIEVFYDYAAEDVTPPPPRMREGSRDFDKQRLEQSKAAKMQRTQALVAKLKASTDKVKEAAEKANAILAPPSEARESAFSSLLREYADKVMSAPMRKDAVIPNVFLTGRSFRASKVEPEVQNFDPKEQKFKYEYIFEVPSKTLDQKILENLTHKQDLAFKLGSPL